MSTNHNGGGTDAGYSETVKVGKDGSFTWRITN
jgi:hypothetical protein